MQVKGKKSAIEIQICHGHRDRDDARNNHRKAKTVWLG